MNNKNNRIGVLGYGEVGKAIAGFYINPLIKDLEKDEFIENMQFMHICIPYSSKFAKIVSENIEKYKPYMVIIHSSVAVGTTEKLYKKYKNVVHSPIRGVHPHLHESVKTFIKEIGADHAGIGRIVAEHFEKLGLRPRVFYKSKTTELAKLIDTTYYGICLAMTNWADELCEKEKLNFNSVMTEYNNAYNEGYGKMDRWDVMRPILYSPKGKIGGHCVLPNSKILKKQYGNNGIIDEILKLQ